MSGTHSMKMVPEQNDENGRERNEAGVYVETYPLEQFRDCLAGEDLATTNEVADCIGGSYQTAYRKLRILEECGEVNSRMLGGTRVWTLVDDQEDDA